MLSTNPVAAFHRARLRLTLLAMKAGAANLEGETIWADPYETSDVWAASVEGHDFYNVQLSVPYVLKRVAVDETALFIRAYEPVARRFLLDHVEPKLRRRGQRDGTRPWDRGRK